MIGRIFRTQPTLIAALVVGGLLRLYNLDYDLPNIYEEATPFRQGWEMWNWGGEGLDFNPRFFNYPAFYFYVNWILQLVAFLIGALFGRYPDGTDSLLSTHTSDPTHLIVIARLFGVLLSTATTYLVARLARRLGQAQVAGFAALAFALLPASVMFCRGIIVDIPLVLFATLALTVAVDIVERPVTSTFVRAGLCLGLAAASKYTGALLVIPLTTATLIGLRDRWAWDAVRNVSLGIAVAVGAFFLTNPYILLDPGGAMAGLLYEQNHMRVGHFGRTGTPLPYYSGALLRNLGIGLSAACLFGLHRVLGTGETRRRWLPGLIFVAGYLAVAGTASTGFEHYLLPVLPVFCVLAVLGCQEISQRAAPAATRTLAAGIVILCLIQPAVASIAEVRASSEPHTRDRMADWIEQHLPAGTSVALEHYGPHIDASVYPVAPIPMDAVRPDAMGPFYDPGWFSTVETIVVSSAVSDRYVAHPDRFPKQARFYRTLDAEWIRRVRMAPGVRDAPTITLYQNPNPRDAVPPDSLYASLAGGDRTATELFLLGLGTLSLKADRVNAAESFLRHLRLVSPDSRMFVLRHVDALMAMGDTSAAVSALQTVSLDSDYERGALYYVRGQLDSATVVWERVAEERPSDPYVRVNLGKLYEGRGQWDRALSAYLEATARTSDDVEPYRAAIGLLIDASRAEEADVLLTRAIARWPKDQDLQILGGRLRALNGDPGGAASIYRAVLTRDPGSADALNLLAGLAYGEGRTEEARSLWERGKEINPTYVPFYTNLGILLYDREGAEAAIEMWYAGLRASPAHPDVSYNLSQALASEGRFADALAVLDAALDAFPERTDLAELKDALTAQPGYE